DPGRLKGTCRFAPGNPDGLRDRAFDADLDSGYASGGCREEICCGIYLPAVLTAADLERPVHTVEPHLNIAATEPAVQIAPNVFAFFHRQPKVVRNIAVQRIGLYRVGYVRREQRRAAAVHGTAVKLAAGFRLGDLRQNFAV